MVIGRRDFVIGGLAAAGIAAASPAVPHRFPKRRIRMGVNYVPSSYWWYSWDEWHPDSIRRDIDQIASIGFDHMRIQLIWPQFQPNANYVSGEKVERLMTMLDFAGEAGVDVEVTVLDGQLSGLLFVPSWLIDNQTGKVHNFMTSPALIETQQALFEALGQAVGGHRSFLGFDIANEIYWATIPLGLSVTPAEGDRWMRALLETCEHAAPDKMHVNGVDKYPYESDGATIFTRTALAASGAATVTHPWEGFYDRPGGLFAQFGALSTEAVHYAEFLIQYLQAFAQLPARRVWIEETGCSKQWMDEALIPQWAEASIRNAAGCEHLYALTWWCSHDPSRRFTGMSPLEYDLGVFTNDRRLKPLGARLRRIIQEFDADPPRPLARPTALVIADDAGAKATMPRFMELVKRGIRPQIVLQSRTGDHRHLQLRGIDRLMR